ncbi:sugar transferase, PEP-CTERM/EpsH1 system associated [Burkholderiales bacterium JOSHI_001]|nr:sugar transferase, PEP-CTERM/EpsH1 system associated [Burkholderiales bacterium JOSHI_001]
MNLRTAPPLILHVIHQFATGGLENGLVNLINHLPHDRFRHAVACVEDYTDFGRRVRREDTSLHALHRSRKGVWQVRRELYALCRKLRPSIVHTRGLSGLDALMPAALAGVQHRIHGEHGWDMHDLNGRDWKTALLKRAHSPLVERYITVSQDLGNYLEQRIHVKRQRITTICNGVDTQRFQPRGPSSPRLLPEGFAPPGCVVIGTVGRLQPVKDQQLLLQAFSRLQRPAADPSGAGAAALRLVLVGDGPLQSDLQAQAQALGIAERTWFAGDRSDVAALLQQLDVFVLPSLAEGISNTLLEAMATGLPLVATRVGGNVELVQDGENGSLVPVGDAAALAQALQALVDNPAQRQAQGAASRQRAERQFSLDAMVAQYQRVYETALQGH